MGNIDDKDLKDVSGGSGQLSELGAGGGGGGSAPTRDEVPTDPPVGGGEGPSAEGTSDDGMSHMGEG